MKDPNRSVQSWSLRELAQMAPAIALGVTVLCFSIGLLIVNLRLAQYGIFSAGFVRTEYVLAGTLYFFLVVFTRASFGVTAYWLNASLETWRDQKYWKALAYIVLAIVMVMSVQIFVLGSLSNYELNILGWQFWATMLTLIFAAYYVQDLTRDLNAVWLRISNRSTTERRSVDWHFRLHSLLGAIMFSLMMVVAYATISYPLLSPAFGGGRRDQVVLIPTKEGMRVCKSIGLPIHMNRTAIGPVDVLTESDHELIVLPKENEGSSFRARAIRLNRDLFEAVITVVPALKLSPK